LELYDWNETPELNITPLVDVMLVLLAILMLASHAALYEETIKLPKGTKQVESDETKKVVVRITADRKVFVGNKSYELLGFEENFSRVTGSMDKESPVLLRADKDLKYEDIMNVLKAFKLSGFTKVALATDG
jgi:biopolymer transport protein ExbD